MTNLFGLEHSQVAAVTRPRSRAAPSAAAKPFAVALPRLSQARALNSQDQQLILMTSLHSRVGGGLPGALACWVTSGETARGPERAFPCWKQGAWSDSRWAAAPGASASDTGLGGATAFALRAVKGENEGDFLVEEFIMSSFLTQVNRTPADKDGWKLTSGG